jgi:putative aldouronate transport system permease protein
MVRNWQLYTLLAPTLIYMTIFEYLPMYGVQIAFRRYNPIHGITGSEWVGIEHFVQFFNSHQFWNILSNTLLISLYELALFPIPVIMALLLNQLISNRFKRVVQTVTYAPHFISVVVLSGMLFLFLSPQTGFVNRLLEGIGLPAIYFLGDESWFKSVFVLSGVWQNLGWGMIIYLAALTAINPELHEAAVVDGASKYKRIWHIDLPGIMPTVMILLILNLGSLMTIGFEKVYLLQTPLNIQSSEIIQTYVYKRGLAGGQFSYAAAIGLFNSAINLFLLITFNMISKKMKQTSLW